MKLNKILEAKKDVKKAKPGTYAGARFSEGSQKIISTFIKDNKIPNGVPIDALHTTILFSRKNLPDYEPYGDYDEPYIATPKELVVWKTQPDGNGNTKNCLIMKLECPKLCKRHKYLMDKHDAEFDFDEFTPHVTLSYDIGDMSIDNIKLPQDELEISKEYHEDLDTEWAKNNTGDDK